MAAAVAATFNCEAAPPSACSTRWEMVWTDEFDTPEMDTAKWEYNPRGRATWSRFIATDPADRETVNKFGEGVYRSFCVANPNPAPGNEMISGAIRSKGKFHMRGCYVEARCRTRAHTGNFPAFWLLPAASDKGWPVCGEIDVWEQIDDQPVAYQTLHHAMRYPDHPNSRKYFEPVGVDSTYVGCEIPDIDPGQWHVYGVEWDAEHLTFYIDGKETYTVENPHFSAGSWTEDVTWPFDQEFYLILNQSVGNGSWAKEYDPAFEYMTEFDYVRAYRRAEPR